MVSIFKAGRFAGKLKDVGSVFHICPQVLFETCFSSKIRRDLISKYAPKRSSSGKLSVTLVKILTKFGNLAQKLCQSPRRILSCAGAVRDMTE
jgi:hypothetical protein